MSELNNPEKSLRELIESCLSRKFVRSENLMIPAQSLLRDHPEIASMMIDYFRKTPDSNGMKEFLGSLIIFYDRTPHKDVFDYVAKFDHHILKDVQSDEELLHYKDAFFK